MSSTITLTLTTEQIETLKQVLGQVIKPVKAPKVRREKGAAPKEKGETPAHLVKWNAYVDAVYTEIKTLTEDEVWDLWAATNPMSKPKKDSGAVPESLATDENRTKFKVIRKIAMAIAAKRKASGEMPAEFIHTPLTDKEKAANKAARAEAKASSASSSEAESETKVKVPRAPKSPRVPKVAAPVPVAPVAPAAVDDDEDGGLEFSDLTHKGKRYLHLPGGESWVRNADGNRGKWAGVFNGSKFDTTVAEPTIEETD